MIALITGWLATGNLQRLTILHIIIVLDQKQMKYYISNVASVLFKSVLKHKKHVKKHIIIKSFETDDIIIKLLIRYRIYNSLTVFRNYWILQFKKNSVLFCDFVVCTFRCYAVLKVLHAFDSILTFWYVWVVCYQ